LKEHDIDLPASYCPLLTALDRSGGANVAELTAAMGLTQPAVTRIVQGLEALRLVHSRADDADRRVRNVELTTAGRQLLARAKHTAWPRIEAAVAQACKRLDGPLLEQLGALELALERAPLHRADGATVRATGSRRRARA